MFKGIENISDSSSVNIKETSILEESDPDLSMDGLRDSLNEFLSQNTDIADIFDENQTWESTELGHSNEVVLEDGTVITLPDDSVSNNADEITGIKYKTDDNGNIYSADGNLLPDTQYELNENIYTTDSNGRIINAQATPVLTPENIRDMDAQKNAGGEDRRAGDQGGHIVGRDMGGDSGEGNLVAMDSRINQSDYKRMEYDIKEALDEGKTVHTSTEISYSGDSERPDTIMVKVDVDGKGTVYTFDNNLDGTLDKRVGEISSIDTIENVKSILNETNGKISSLKEEFDSNGDLSKATVNITYKDENNKTQRTKIIIDDPKGAVVDD